MTIFRRSAMRSLPAICLLVLSACNLSSSTTGEGGAPLPDHDAKIEGAEIGNLAYEIEGKAIADGKAVQLSRLKGKVVLLDFWAPWCKPCVDAIPHEKQLVARFAGKPFALIGISTDGVGTHVLPWPNIDDENASINQKWRIEAIPTFVLINPQGEIVGRWVGAQDLPQIDKAIERELELVEKRK